MDLPGKTIFTLGCTLGASTYFGLGVYGSLAGMSPRIVPGLSVLSFVLVGAGTPLCARGIARVRALRERVRAREAAPAGDRRAAPA